MVPSFHFFPFHILERTHALEHLVKVHLMAVELRTVHADKLRLSSHRDAAGTTHARSIYHDGIQRHVGRYLIFLCQQAAELHHDGRTDGKTLVHLLSLDDALDAFRYQSFISV